MSQSPNPPSALPPRPDLEWYKKAAKKLLRELKENDPSAKLADAQLEVAREHGFGSWRAMVQAIELQQNELARFLHACANGDLETVTASLEQNPNWINIRDDRDWTPLHHAVCGDFKPITEKNLKLVDLLLSWKPDLEAIGEEGNIGRCTPLHLAAFTGNDRSPIIRKLISAGADVNVVSSSGSTALFDAARHHEEDICKLLIKHGAIVDLDSAVAMNDLISARLILEKEDSPELPNPIRYATSSEMRNLLAARGYRPTLHDAAASGWNEMVIKLVDENPQSINAYNDNGQTPLHLAVNEGHQSTVDLLISRGADIQAIWIKPGPGWSAIELAKRRNIVL